MIRAWAPAGILIMLVGAAFFPSDAQQPRPAAHQTKPTVAVASAAAPPHGRAFDEESLWQTWKVYCYSCHVGPRAPAGMNLMALDEARLDKNGVVWEKILLKLRNREMPPAGRPRPDAATYEAMVAYMEDGLHRAAVENPNPGRPAVHRLNRAEYANVVRDLLGLEIDTTELLPPDDSGYGFDNIGDVLTVSPLLMDRYLSTAERVSLLAVGDPAQGPSFKTYDVPTGLVQDERMGEDLPFGSRGGTLIRHDFPADGEYVFKILLQRGRRGNILGLGPERQLDLRVDDQRIKLFTIAAAQRGRPQPGAAPNAAARVRRPQSGAAPNAAARGGGPQPDAAPQRAAVDDNLEIRVPVKAGTRSVMATFVYDTIKPEAAIVDDDGDNGFFDGVGSVSISGPFNAQGPGTTASREKIFVCHPTSQADELPCAEKILSTLAHRAYRRPITDADLASLMELYRDGAGRGGFEAGIRLALQKILVSPEFLFRIEFDPPNAAPGSAYQISDLELASRLSFFLWSSIPDDELLKVAERGELKDPAMLARQVRRMLADPRSEALVTNFAGQWLYLRNLSGISPAPDAFPNFDENLRDAMKRETELLIDSMLREDRSVVDLLDSDYTFVNDRLARHYGMQGIYGAEFRRVSVTDEARKGLLGQASILTVTSYPNRTAPTIRGKWLLEQLLGTAPPPPPPNVPSLPDNENTRAMTMRQRMEQHRRSPACASCHQRMDPLGFALENFDGLGRWRDVSGAEESAVDASGQFPDGTAFNGPAGLRKVLLSKRELFVDTFTKKLLTYAMGRGVEYYDLPAVRQITRDAAKSDYRWSSIISGIVNSVPFRMRRVAS